MPSLTDVLADPMLVQAWIERPQLLASMGAPATGTMARLTVLMAPTGYGKSVLAAQWMRQRQDADEVAPVMVVVDGTTLAWPSSSLPALDAGLRAVIEELDQGADGTMAAERFADLVEATPNPVVIVFDDLDRFRPAVRERLLVLLLVHGAVPPNLHVLALCRRPILHPIGVLTVRNWVRLLTQADLAFTDAELAEIGAGASATAGSAGTPDLAEERWPAGAHLLARQPAGPGRWYALADYVLSTMRDLLDPDSQALLIACGDVPVLTPTLWQHLATALGLAPMALGEIATLLPFSLADDDGLQFSPTVRASLRPPHTLPDPVRDRVNDLAIAWFFQHDRPHEAIQLAVSGDRWPVAYDCVVETCRALAICDRSGDVIRLLAPVPEPIIAESEDLSFWMVLSLGTLGRLDDAARYHRRVARRSGSPLSVGRELLIDASMTFLTTDYETAIAGFERTLDILPTHAHHERMRAASTAEYAASFLDGNRRRSERFAAIANEEREALPACQHWWSLFVMPLRADNVGLGGNLHEARTMLEYQIGTLPDELRGRSHTLLYRLARIDIEQGDLDAASSRIGALSAPYMELLWPSAAITIASLLHAQGRSDEAIATLYDAIREAERHRIPYYIRSLRTLLAQIWIDTDNIALAEHWVRDAERQDEGWPPSVGFPLPQLVIAQFWLATEAWERGVRVLLDLIADGELRRQQAPLVRAYALLAFAYTHLNRHDLARDAMLQAVGIGNRGRFARSFDLRGTDLRTLLRMSPRHASSTKGPQEGGRAMLTDRETQVLALVADGLSNQQIAERLFISRFTVKNHLARAYSVLSVKNRRECVEVARRLGLI